MKKYFIALMLFFIVVGSTQAGVYLYNTGPMHELNERVYTETGFNPIYQDKSLDQLMSAGNGNNLETWTHDTQNIMDGRSGFGGDPHRFNPGDHQFIGVTNAPEPGSIILFLVGLIGCGVLRKRISG